MKEQKFVDIFAYKPTQGEVNNGPYLIEPNQAMTLREIFEKFRLGIPIGDQVKDMQYNETDEMPRYDIDKMDLIDELNAINSRVKRATTKRNEVKASGKPLDEEVKEVKENENLE